MRVLMINSVCGIRSTGRICTDLAEKMIMQGDTVKIAYGRESVPEKYQSIAVRIGTDLGVYINALKARFFDNEGFNCKSSTRTFLKWADEYDPELLWIHNLHGYYINVEMLFDWIKKRPSMKVKWTLHDCWAFTGHCAYFSYVNCDQWRKKCEKCSQINKYPVSFVDNCKKNFIRKKAAFTGVNDMTLVSPSAWLADLAKQSYLHEYPVEVVHNTINTDVFQPSPSDFKKKYGVEGKKIILGVASVWEERKGLQDFYKLSEMISDRFAIVLVGLDKRRCKSRLPDNIIAIQRTNNQKELAEIYTAADVFVNTTYEDNYPTVNLEARACGTTVVTYRTGGSPESVDEANVVECGDVKALWRRLSELLKVS